MDLPIVVGARLVEGEVEVDGCETSGASFLVTGSVAAPELVVRRAARTSGPSSQVR